MRDTVHSEYLAVRLHPELLAAADAQAKSRQMTRAEFVRDALRQRIFEQADR
jgi:metal-responsive CopG/Arc/MetJ family transcriptional regulator